MSVLPRISGREVAAALTRIGYQMDRQKGSHMVLRTAAPPHRRIVVPDHREVAKGTLRAIKELQPLLELREPPDNLEKLQQLRSKVEKGA